MCKISGPEIETSGKHAWRTHLYDGAGQLNENTCSGAVDGRCEFTREMLPALERAVEHEDMTEKLAGPLTTCAAEVKYEVETNLLLCQASVDEFTSHREIERTAI